MSSLRPDVIVNGADLLVQVAPTSAAVPYMTQVPDLGVRATTGDGREFRFASAGAAALIVGQLQQDAAISANLTDVTAVAIAAGALTTTLTISTGTAIVANQLAGGFYTTYGTVANGGGQISKISSNTAVTASGTSITLKLEDAMAAVTTSATVTIIPPTCSAVIQAPSTITGKIVGVAVNNLAATYYGWLQVKGIANALIAGTPAIGTGLSGPNSGTAGALQVTAATLMDIAYNLKTGVNGQYGPVSLRIS